MEDINSLQEAISLAVSTNSSDARSTLDKVERCLELMKEQGIGAGVFTKPIFHFGYQICVRAGDKRGAQKYLLKELVAVRQSEGTDSPKGLEIEGLLSHLVP